MPTKTKADEAKWERAKQIAKDQGQAEAWPLIMHIYKNMDPDYKFKTAATACPDCNGRIAKGQGPVTIEIAPLSSIPDQLKHVLAHLGSHPKYEIWGGEGWDQKHLLSVKADDIHLSAYDLRQLNKAGLSSINSRHGLLTFTFEL